DPLEPLERLRLAGERQPAVVVRPEAHAYPAALIGGFVPDLERALIVARPLARLRHLEVGRQRRARAADHGTPRENQRTQPDHADFMTTCSRSAASEQSAIDTSRCVTALTRRAPTGLSNTPCGRARLTSSGASKGTSGRSSQMTMLVSTSVGS